MKLSKLTKTQVEAIIAIKELNPSMTMAQAIDYVLEVETKKVTVKEN